uniref:Uncharacterized protein n=1 Tax=Biomphalaria glabrata TaxID=6526 RepID=A0A2C9LV71_BIOGL
MGERNSYERLIGNVTTKQCHHHGKPELCAPSGTEYVEPCQRMNDLHLSEHSENVERESAASTSEISPIVQATANMAEVSVSTASSKGSKDEAQSVDPERETLTMIGNGRPKYTEMASLVKRLKSFERCFNLIKSKEELAEAGFYYDADGNCTRCFECGIGLTNWQPSDDVWIEHAKFRKTCAWLLEKKGQKFIDDVAQKFQCDVKSAREEMLM